MNLLTALLALVPASMSAQQPRDFGAASFVPPAGWAVDSRADMQTFSRVRGPHRCMVAISAPEPAPRGLDGAFTTMWTSAFNPNNYRRADRPATVERVSPAGHRHVVGEAELEDRGGNRIVARLHVFPVGQRTQSVVLIGSSRAAIDDCRQDWETFFASLRFSPAPPEAQVAGAPPATRSPDAASAVPSPTPSPGTPPPNDPAPRTPQQFDNITFVPPEGWSVRRTAGVVQLAPTDMKTMERLQVVLLPGRRSTAPLANEFDAAWSEVRSQLRGQQMLTVNRVPYDLEQPTRSLRGHEYLRGRGALRLADGTHAVELYVFRVGDRTERVAVLSRDFRDNVLMVTTWNKPSYGTAIRELVFTMKFANQPERPVSPAGLRPGGIVGVWAGLGMSMGRIKPQFAIFFDNGMAYYGSKFPSKGLLDVDPAVEQPAYVREWGTYTMSGEAGVVTMPYGTIPLRRLGTALELTTNRTPHRFVRMAMPDGPLDGTWCYDSGPCLRLTADGRFEDNGAVRVAEHSTYAYPSTPAGGQGRYSLRAYTIVLTYDSGPEIRMGFAGLPSDRRAPSPADIRLGFEADLLSRR